MEDEEAEDATEGTSVGRSQVGPHIECAGAEASVGGGAE